MYVLFNFFIYSLTRSPMESLKVMHAIVAQNDPSGVKLNDIAFKALEH